MGLRRMPVPVLTLGGVHDDLKLVMVAERRSI